MRVGIIGWYGYGNLGDEILLEVVIGEVLKFVNRDDVIVFSERPSDVEKSHRIKSVIIGYEGKLGEFIDALEKIDILIWGGGGSFSDWQKEALPNIFKIISIAKALNKRIFLYSIGCGPITTENGKRIMQEICKLCDFVTVRDIGSYKLLKELDIEELYLTSDPAVTYDSYPVIRSTRTKTINLGICVSYLFNNENLWPNQFEKFFSYKVSMIKLLNEIVKKHLRTKIWFIPVFPKDEDFARELMLDLNLDNISLIPYRNYDEIVGSLAKMDIVISTRLHAIILSRVCCTISQLAFP